MTIIEFEESIGQSKEKNILTDVVVLNRKIKMFGSSIEMILSEIEHLENSPNARLEMEGALRRLNDLEKSYGNVVQEIIASITNEITVDEEIRKWAVFQQEIIRISRKAENYMSLRNREESRLTYASHRVESHKGCS
jgi:hypothetical protein